MLPPFCFAFLPESINHRKKQPKGQPSFSKWKIENVVGNAVLSVPKKRTVGDDGPYRKPALCKEGQIAHRRERF